MWPIIAYNIITNNNLWQYKLKVMWDSKQNQDQDMYLKFVFNRLNVRCDFLFIYTHWVPNSKLFKKLSTYMWSIFTHVHPCVHYKQTKIQLKMN